MYFSTLATALFAAPLVTATGGRGREKGLHRLAREAGFDYFGTAIDNPSLSPNASLGPYSIANSKYKAIAYDREEFGQVTPANGLKWMYVEPERGVFNFTLSDEVLKPAQKNAQLVRCHNLVWHSQLPAWVSAQNFTKTEMLSIMENHIKNEVTKYKGQCFHWDVVNEAFNEDGTLRPSPFLTSIGPDYIAYAFKFANKYEKKAQLYYNDYNIETVGPKSAAVVALVKELQAKDIRIDGVGLQSHFTVGDSPSYEAQKANMAQFTALDVDVAITELDIRMVLPDSDAKTAQQATDYENTVRACKDTEGCVGITLWDFYDPFSWIPNAGGQFAGQGNPLPYREGFSKKPAYYAIRKVLEE